MDERYAAGLVDGEGYIGISHPKAADTYAIRVAVAMVTKGSPILSSMERSFGGRINSMKAETERNATKDRWVVDGQEAADFLARIAPHLILKHEQAMICLEFHDRITASRAAGGRFHWTDELRRQGEIAKRRIHDLNSRGPAPSAPALPPIRPLARIRWGAWWEPDEGLFGPIEFAGKIPTSGRMVNGHIYPS